MAKSVFKNLSSDSKKGENGTVLIIGGSRRYTGAPIFAAKAAMRTGAEIVYVFCKKKALLPIKSLHEAIVMPIKYDEHILDKITACVVGPGLGRLNDKTLGIILQILNRLNTKAIPIVVDADAIHYYKMGLFNNYRHCIVTPNYKEKIGLTVEKGHLCIYKGSTDVVTINNKEHVVNVVSSGKRCGGQGDILSGVISTAVSVHGSESLEVACVSACELTRKASRAAFVKMGYGMITSDVIDNLAICLSSML
ncbi:ATP-dependent NAD(P)H-hydrate dehydratase [Pancytospora epiphaga]|nr:ATP-dependent NAD(P)H-hydrate dehydratase [Pancytospora epiphaga]